MKHSNPRTSGSSEASCMRASTNCYRRTREQQQRDRRSGDLDGRENSGLRRSRNGGDSARVQAAPNAPRSKRRLARVHLVQGPGGREGQSVPNRSAGQVAALRPRRRVHCEGAGNARRSGRASCGRRIVRASLTQTIGNVTEPGAQNREPCGKLTTENPTRLERATRTG